MDRFCKKLISYSPKNILSTSIKTDELELGKMKNNTTRELEYQAGRYCANKLLEDFGLKIDSNNKKELFPNWPKDIVGSISHCKGRAISAVANKSNYTALGIDLEKLNRLKINSLRFICHEFEIKQIGNNLKLATILFSLKEAIYKAQYPTYKYKLNF